MTPEANSQTTTDEIDDELNTTAPQSRPAAWKMPEPIFRCTSGKLPRGYEKQYESDPKSSETDRFGSDGHVAPEPTAAPADAARPEPKPKSPTLKIVVVVLGITAMIAFLVVFLTIVYFMFLRT